MSTGSIVCPFRELVYCFWSGVGFDLSVTESGWPKPGGLGAFEFFFCGFFGGGPVPGPPNVTFIVFLP